MAIPLKATASGAVPLLGLAEAVAPRVGETTTVAIPEAVLPVESVTVRVGSNVPAVVYVWVELCPAAAADPSPNAQLYVYGAIPPCAEPLKLTPRGASPAPGRAVATAASGPLTVITPAEATAWNPLASVTVTLGV
jgi:hypothetical protein